jgi:hypothetical protein
MTGHEPLTAIVFWAFIGIAACGLMVCATMLYPNHVKVPFLLVGSQLDRVW